MTIDVKPKVRKANEREKLIMEIYKYKELFYFVQGDKQYSVEWTKETLKEFLPNLYVSEYIENHLVKYSSIFSHCMEYWEKGLHPYWYQQVNYIEDENKRIPQSLNQEYVKDSARYWLKNSYEQFTKPLEFVKVKL